MRALVTICTNKHWLPEMKRKYVLCIERKNNIERFIRECAIADEWFKDLGTNKEDSIKSIWRVIAERKEFNVTKKFWVEKEKSVKI